TTDTWERLPEGNVAIGSEPCNHPSDREGKGHGGTCNTCHDSEDGENPGTDHAAPPDAEGSDQPDIGLPCSLSRRRALHALAVDAVHRLTLASCGVTLDSVLVFIGSRIRYASSFTRSVTRNHARA